MKTIKHLFLMGIISIAVTSCSKESLSSDFHSVPLTVAGDGASMLNQQIVKDLLIETSQVSDVELASLLKMKEEEKLAHDVYEAFFAKWGSIVFQHISVAESNHLNAVINLLKFYDSSDTIAEEAGKFNNPEFQKMYDELLSKGIESLSAAYQIGALIEEMDIKDLQDELDRISNVNIQLIYENLQKGSRNHLRAFTRQLASLGVAYTPVYLSVAEYDQIVNSPMEKGSAYRQGKGNCQRVGKRNGRN